MKHSRPDTFFVMGLNFRFFREVANNPERLWLIKGEQIDGGIGLIEALTREVDALNELELGYSTVIEMEKFRELIVLGNYPNESKLKPEHAKQLKTLIDIWEDRIIHEMANVKIVILSEDGILNFQKLAAGPGSFFGLVVWNKIPEIARVDLEESVKCIMFELPTPAGFLALRATEAMLREYYSKKTNIPIQGVLNWGQILNKLKALKINDSLIGHLDFLRKNLRNKLSHPDAILSQNEAENVFSMIVTSISEMAKDI